MDRTQQNLTTARVILQADPDARRLLEYLHRGGAFGYWWGVTGEARVSRWWPVGQPAPIPTAEHVYFGVHPASEIPHRGNPANLRATIPDIAAVSCLFAEFDAKDEVREADLDPGELARILADVQAQNPDLTPEKARAAALATAQQLAIQRDPAPYMARALAHIDGLAVAPSVVIGSGGGYHAYWLLRAPFMLASNEERERARRLQAAWVGYVGGDGAAKDLARVLRVPGTVNRKYDPPRPVVILRADYDRLLYTMPDLETLSRPPERLALAPSNGHGRGPAEDTGQHWLDWALGLARIGNRNQTGFDMACQLRDDGLSMTEAEDWLLAYARSVPQSQSDFYSEAAALASCKSAYAQAARDRAQRVSATPQTAHKAAPADEPPAWLGDSDQETPATRQAEHLTDMGNAARLVRLHGADLRYCYPWARWLHWDGGRWAVDDCGEVTRRAKATIKTLFTEAATADDDTAKALAKHALRSQALQRINGMVTLAQSEPGIPVRPGELDLDPWLLNVQNGVLDLRSGVLRAHDRANLLTKMAPVAYDPSATCPTWEAFLTRVMGGDAELIHFLQRAIGYSLTGDTSEQAIFIFFGTGANGKSTFLETIRGLLGDDYARQVRTETLMDGQRGTGPTEDLARLKGARFVSARETEEGKRLAEALIKELSGGDTLTARFLYSESFEYKPAFKLFLGANHKPVIRGTDYAIWRRIRLVPFAVTIPPEEQDKQLPQKLQAELPGILAWAVRGCRDWQQSGLGAPAAVTEATTAYRAESDVLSAFLAECTVADPKGEVQAKLLFEAYKTWAEDNGEKPMTAQMFGRRLTERGLDKYKDRKNFTFYMGLSLANQEPQSAPIRA